ncbi:hypothetical protein BJF91_20105 [Allorhizobium taibaishanense]|uniref:Uncharacterized protein n=1 Tax=Allorhizobium taibaishanense TaxID=887144 RepID=A0A1Q9A445_9HYPH|nr:hypothetical protein BJF91_20105 [Allorhizobium taibaishanense]
MHNSPIFESFGREMSLSAAERYKMSIMAQLDHFRERFATGFQPKVLENEGLNCKFRSRNIF